MSDVAINMADTCNQVDFSACKTPAEGLKKVKETLSTEVPLLERKFLSTERNADPEKELICIMQWNILAQGLTGGEDNFIRTPPEVFQKDRRRLRILQQILTVDPDILCVQEMDQFAFFQNVLKHFGYEGFFVPKPNSPCLNMPNNCGPDGCAIFYKTLSLKLLYQEQFYLDSDTGKPTRPSLILDLIEKKSGKAFCVATTHLKAKEGFESLRLHDGQKLLEKLDSKTSPIIVCGDFNAAPTEPVIEAYRDSPLNLKNVYGEIEGMPQYTTWKIRPRKSEDGSVTEMDVCKNIDYIWCSRVGIEVAAVLSIPTEEEIGKNRLPSHSYPSDHLAIAASVKL